MSRSISFNMDIEIGDFYDELYDSDKKVLLEWLREENFVTDEDEEIMSKFSNLETQYFRFTKEDEEILETLFNKYIV